MQSKSNKVQYLEQKKQQTCRKCGHKAAASDDQTNSNCTQTQIQNQISSVKTKTILKKHSPLNQIV